MYVQGTVPSRRQQRRWQQESICSDDQSIRPCGTYTVHAVWRPEIGWLENLQAALYGGALYGARNGPQAPTRGTVGLREHQSYIVAGGSQPIQGPLSEWRRACED